MDDSILREELRRRSIVSQPVGHCRVPKFPLGLLRLPRRGVATKSGIRSAYLVQELVLFAFTGSLRNGIVYRSNARATKGDEGRRGEAILPNAT